MPLIPDPSDPETRCHIVWQCWIDANGVHGGKKPFDPEGASPALSGSNGGLFLNGKRWSYSYTIYTKSTLSGINYGIFTTLITSAYYTTSAPILSGGNLPWTVTQNTCTYAIFPPFPDPPFPNPPPPDPIPPPFPDPIPPIPSMDCCPEVLDILRVLVVRLNKVTEDVNEINDSLETPKFAKDDNNPDVKRAANLGYYIERIARVLGISVNSDGSIRSIRQKRIIERGNAIPTGWNFGQWGANTGANAAGQIGGNSNELRDGIIYEQRSNYKDLDPSNPSNITIHQGNYTLCENIPQLLDEVLDDLDKALGWQDLGANIIPNADGSGKYCSFEGLAQLLVEVGYDLSRISQFASQTQISSLITQAVSYELLKATGQPLAPKSFAVDIGGDQVTSIPYTGLDGDAPSQLEQTGWLMQNLAPILAAIIKLKEDTTPTP